MTRQMLSPLYWLARLLDAIDARADGAVAEAASEYDGSARRRIAIEIRAREENHAQGH